MSDHEWFPKTDVRRVRVLDQGHTGASASFAAVAAAEFMWRHCPQRELKEDLLYAHIITPDTGSTISDASGASGGSLEVRLPSVLLSLRGLHLPEP